MAQTAVAQRRRIIAPDLARGLALFGIAWANISTAWAIAPADARGAAFGGVGPFGLLDEVAVLLSAMFAHVRGLPMFTTLLGFGIGLIALSLAGRGFPRRDAKKTLARRYAWLAAFGLLHGVLLLFGDIMFTYGILALIVILLIGRSDRTLLITAGVIWFLATAFSVGAGLLAPPEYLGTDLGQLLPEFPNYPLYVGFNAMWMLITAVSSPATALSLLPVMLVGFVAARRGVHLNIDKYRPILWAAVIVTVLVIFSIGLPMGLVALGVLPEQWAGALSMINQSFGLLTGPGIAAGILLACEPLEKKLQIARADGEELQLPLPLRIIAALGKRSMSGYVAQSVLLVIICLPFAFDFGAEIGAFGQLLLALGVWTVTLALAWLLELAGLPGPLEQLHRRLSYGRDGLPATWPAGQAGQARLPGPEGAKEASASALSDRAER